MEKTCNACGQPFRPAFVFQIAVTPSGQRSQFCSLPTFYDGRTRLAREVLETLQGHFKHRCLEPIRLNTRLAEAPSHNKTLFEYAPSSHGAADYNRVVDRVLATTARTETTLQPDPTPAVA